MVLKVTLDRIEEHIAVLLIQPDEIHEISWPSDYLPQGSKEGSVLTLRIDVEPQDTKALDKRVRGLLEKLRDKQKG